MRLSLLLLASLLWATPPLRGQSPQLHMEVDTAVVTVGDRITLTVSVDHASDSRVVWPDSLDLAPFEILGGQALPPVPGEESNRSSLVLGLAAFELGELEIPAFEIEVVDAQGVATPLTTNRFGIQVLSVGLDEGGDIREIRGPLGIPVGIVRISTLLLALILAAALAWFLLRRFRRREPEPRSSTPAAHYRPPHELALEALARIEESSLLERGQVKEYHIKVSEVIRTYIEGRFQVPALEMTTRDIIQGVGKGKLATATLEGFEDFLNRCDMVKFAKHRPGLSDSEAVLGKGRSLVEDTIPSPPGDLQAQASDSSVPPPDEPTKSGGGHQEVVT